VRRQTATALTSAAEKTWITSLIELHGVSWPTASVILHLAHIEPCPILDVRSLWSLQYERSYYTFAFWWEYLCACRALAVECHVSMRDLDRALWQYSNEKQREKHCEIQLGGLPAEARRASRVAGGGCHKANFAKHTSFLKKDLLFPNESLKIPAANSLAPPE
jgi:hypothetical protein